MAPQARAMVLVRMCEQEGIDEQASAGIAGEAVAKLGADVWGIIVRIVGRDADLAVDEEATTTL